MPLLPTVLNDVLERLAQRALSEEPMGLTTGLPRLDEVLGEGWERQQLSYLVGDSGIGKSWLALWFVLQGAKWLAAHPDQRPRSDYLVTTDLDVQLRERVQAKEGKPPLVVYWSLEMAEFMCTVRMVSMAAKMGHGCAIDSARLKLGQLHDHEKLAMAQAHKVLATEWGPHVFVEFNVRTIFEFRQVLDELATGYDIVFVVIDYFRHIDEFEGEGAAQIQAARSSGLKDVAKMYDCHVLCIFDITRIGQRAGQVRLSHMKDGTAAQFDADAVLIMNEHETQGKKGGGYDTDGLVWLEVAKNRHGETATLHLSIDRSTGFFEETEKVIFT